MYKELIKRLKDLPHLMFVQLGEHEELVYQAADAIEELEAINEKQLLEIAVLGKERKKGKWISHLLDDGSFWANYCSECGEYLPYGLDWKPNGCPNCFADMRGETWTN